MEIIKKIKVYNMISEKSQQAIPNQFEISTDDATYFQSYRTVIVAQTNGKTYLDPDWDYSRTTGKYRNQFLRETRKETEKKIKSGEYIVTNLN